MLSARELAQIHVGLQLDRFPPEEVAARGAVVLENVEWRRGAPLAARLRSMHAARAIVGGSLTAPVPESTLNRARECLSTLIEDREPAVASPAAGALGALGLALDASDATHARRAVSASAVRWLLGQANDGWMKGDEFALAEAIRALTPWRSVAPQTLDDAVRALRTNRSSHLAQAVAEYVISLPADAFAAFSRPVSPVIEHWRALRADPSEANLAALLKSVARAVKEGADDDALDMVLCTSTLVPDLMLATSESEDEGSARWKAWSSIMGRTLARRVERLTAGREHKVAMRETVRRVARIYDASSPSVRAASKVDLVPVVYEELARNKDTMLDRSLARLFATVIDAPPADIVALLLPLSPRVLRLYATTFAGSEALILREICAVHGSLSSSSGKAKKRAAELDARLQAVANALVFLGDVPLARALDPLLRAAMQLLRNESAGALDAILAAAIRDLNQAVREVLERRHIAVPSSAGVSGAKTSARLRAFITEARHDVEARRKELNRLLPRVFEDLLDAVITLRGSLDPEARGPRPGAVIGDYVVVRALGAGAMGSCVLARPRSRGAADVVLKMPRRTTPLYRSFFRKEAIALLRLVEAEHAGIVRFVAFVDGAGAPPHLVMERVVGSSLEERLASRLLTPAEALRMTAVLARALAHAHWLGVGHHDVKPGNVMLAKDDAPVLVDWGIAGAAFQAGVGTPEYMSPERAGAPTAGVSPFAGDVYALGCVLIEAVSGMCFLGEPTTREDEAAEPGLHAYLSTLDETQRRLRVAHKFALTPALRESRIHRALATAPPWARDLASKLLDPNPATRPNALTVAKTLESQGY